jgi:hypothetical protein
MKHVLLLEQCFIFGASVISENMGWGGTIGSFTGLVFTGNIVWEQLFFYGAAIFRKHVLV